jgi:hypothetical protein
MKIGRVSATQFAVGNINVDSGSRTNFSIDSAYSHGVSGDAIAIRWMATTADPIDELYVFLDANGGTLGSITLACDVYNEGSTAARPGSTLRDSSTATTMPGAVDKWIKFTFGTPYTPAVGEILWLVIYNTSASPTIDYPQIMLNPTWGGTAQYIARASYAYTTTAGFSADGTVSAKVPFVLVHGANVSGQPWTREGVGQYANNTRERGFVCTPTSDIEVYGAEFGTNTGAANVNELKIYDNSTAPGGTPLHTFDFDSDANETTGDLCQSKVFDAPITLSGGVTYKVALSFGSSTQGPYRAEIEDYASYSSVFDALRAFNTLTAPWGCLDDGAGGWTIDKAVCPSLALYIDDTVAGSSGGGGQRVIGG